jgi:transcriptional regulator with GAF, ATPase, and Fis domain
MFDTTRFEQLHIVRKLREKIRKWWNIEFAFADATGYVVDHAKGIVIPPHNLICQASLGCRDGFAKCNKSVERACKEFTDVKGVHAHIVDTCHLGFPIIVVPIVADSRYYGSVFTCGFLIKEREMEKHAILGRARENGWVLGADEDVFRTIPVLEAKDLDYLCDLLETTVEEIIAFSQALQKKEDRIRQLTREIGGRYQFGNIVGKSAAMQRLFRLLEKVVDSDSTVLITGENGTGKELIARALHYNGPRKDKSFVVQNCSALNDNLLESELFGHVRGSFTGAMKDKKGLFEVAHKGTFFLDEVGDMSPAMQVKLLRVLQEGTLIPVGATQPKLVDVRVITATNKDLKEMVSGAGFREDLYYRLNVIHIKVPPLRERLDDLPLLVDHFLAKHAGRTGKPIKRLAPEVMARFYEYHWPGNIRELENELERLVVLSGEKDEVTPDLLSTGVAPFVEEKSFETFRQKGTMEAAIQALERDMIEHGLIQTHWNKTKLARKLGISRTTLIKKIKDYGLSEHAPRAFATREL